MLKRLSLFIMIAALIFLLGAIYIRFIDTDNNVPDNNPSNPSGVTVSEITTTALPTETLNPTITPAPTRTLVPVEDKTRPVSGQLTEGVVGRISKINPLFAEFNPVDQDITALMFEGLTDINEYGEVVPDLAERWGVSPDGLDYVFALRRDVLWHDGVPFTSADVKFTIDVMRSVDFQGDKSLTTFWRTVEMTLIDDYTVRFRLVQPLASFPEHLRLGFLPRHVFDGFPVAELDRHPANLDPIGTGPYQLESLLAENGQIAGITLRVAPTYRQREPDTSFTIDRIILRTFPNANTALGAFFAGEVNSVAHVPPEYMVQLSGIPHIALHTTLYPAVGVLIYNWERSEVNYFEDQRTRLALAHGLDHISAVNSTLNTYALPAQSPLVQGSWAYREYAYPVYNSDTARSMIDEIDFSAEVETEDDASAEEDESEATVDESDAETTSEDKATATPPETTSLRRNFSILVFDNPQMIALANNIASQWTSIGLTVEVEAVDAVAYRKRLQAGDFDTAIVEYSFAPYADPDSYSFWHVGQYQDGLNYGGLRDLRISESLEKARREVIGLNRVTYYDEFQAYFAERVPALPLYYPLYSYVVDDRLAGVQLGFITTPADRFRTLPDWHWELE